MNKAEILPELEGLTMIMKLDMITMYKTKFSGDKIESAVMS